MTFLLNLLGFIQSIFAILAIVICMAGVRHWLTHDWGWADYATWVFVFLVGTASAAGALSAFEHLF